MLHKMSCVLAYQISLFIIFVTVCIGMIISIVFGYDRLVSENNSSSQNDNSWVYIYSIPFYIYIFGYVLVYPIKKMIDDSFEHKMTIGELVNGVYVLKLIGTIIKRAFFSGLFFVTIIFLANDANFDYQISIYLYVLGSYTLISWFCQWIGSFVEVFYYDGTIYSGTNIDGNDDKKVIAENKLYRIYLFERSSNGISISNINYTTLFDPVHLSFGVSLIVSANSLSQNSLSMLVTSMANICFAIKICILVSVILSTLLMIIYYCIFGKIFGRFGYALFYVYLIMLCQNLNYLFGTYFYEGFVDYLNGSTDSTFILYIIGMIAYQLVIVSVFQIMAMYVRCKN